MHAICPAHNPIFHKECSLSVSPFTMAQMFGHPIASCLIKRVSLLDPFMSRHKAFYRRGGGWRSNATSCNTADAPVNSISSPPVTIPEFSPLDRCFPTYSHVIGFRKSLPHLHIQFFYASFYAWSGIRRCAPVWPCSNILPEGWSQVFGNLTRSLIRSPYTQNS